MCAPRDVEAVARASGCVKHGINHWGGTVAKCVCRKQPCGGVADDDQRRECPKHRREPVQVWHWAVECPAR